MKQQQRNRCESICVWLLIAQSIFIISSCTNGYQANPGGNNVATNVSFPTASPSSTPLLCPNDNGRQGQGPFVKEDGIHFVYQGRSLEFYGYTFYPSLLGGSAAWRGANFTHYIDHILDMGAQAGQNLVRPTDFWDEHYHNQRQDDVIIWKNLDYLICAAKLHGMFVILDVSAFKSFLVSQGYDPYNARNWITFLDAVGKHYINQPSIAFYSILGEAPPPKSVAEMNRLIDFYRALTDELHKADGNHHLITAGGFNHMEDDTPQTPWWQRIYSLPNNDIVAFKTYSQDDLNLIPTISAFAKTLGKPFIDEEFGLPQGIGDATFTGATYNNIHISRAQFYEDVYSRGEINGVTGFVFWNMGCEIAKESYEVNPNTPYVWHVIQEYAPNAPNPTDLGKKLC